MELGLKRGTVRLVEHQSQWEEDAKDVIKLLKQILGETAVDIQHVGSTAIPSIHAKPIVDIAVAVRNFDDLQPYVEVLERHRIVFRGKVVDGDILFVMGEKDMRTHHIHVVQWNGPSWNHYIAFRTTSMRILKRRCCMTPTNKGWRRSFPATASTIRQERSQSSNSCWPKRSGGSSKVQEKRIDCAGQNGRKL